MPTERTAPDVSFFDVSAENGVSGEVIELIGDIVWRYMTAYEHAAAEQSLTIAQAKVLALLTKEPLPMRRLADRMACEPSNITGIIDRLELRGLVERHPDPHDRRVKYAAATDEGAEMTGRLCRSLQAAFTREPLAGLSPMERVVLRDLLKRLLGEDAAV
ncbi:MarR family winged helix-turn-helix transcriptional regulator [Streptomyces qinzhouensis]|uniref:MarR family transcriptional regulator n=1 Tax=Streptomyces qinzhouensis TaxID=2599401 RepID=A0A5B8IDU0_9ACTN|nr:MarR family transcriptional regulator [Streptomyces qinzhouensis]QDY76618.1 MarR family transcriptional regulator [Streptomyces qinzhouensis]